ncbi:TetR/AcrR family transcriptional regulator [Lachnobacterium bovis]|uniref:Transcriptional regulator, TetR family n=1 Tax=Lachnobacterium bovis TaxID=140626 RepID=A0A1H9QZA8_9FIRM|nr:TetR/AcrR family transcriptional regulator [Lachnobacterium bovis]SER65790.1 transcriptional regulator, TetR family [Lachnobacterium bovis]
MVDESKKIKPVKKEKIIDTCISLYEKISFDDVTIRKICNKLNVSTASIYLSFSTKEEIFVAILIQEIMKWNERLEGLLEYEGTLDDDEFLSEIANTVEERKLLLKIIGLDLYAIEDMSSIESLVRYKEEYKKCMFLFEFCLEKYKTNIDSERRIQIVHAFFHYTKGLYLTAYPTKKQKLVMKNAKIPYEEKSLYDLSYQFLKLIL